MLCADCISVLCWYSWLSLKPNMPLTTSRKWCQMVASIFSLRRVSDLAVGSTISSSYNSTREALTCSSWLGFKVKIYDNRNWHNRHIYREPQPWQKSYKPCECLVKIIAPSTYFVRWQHDHEHQKHCYRTIMYQTRVFRWKLFGRSCCSYVVNCIRHSRKGCDLTAEQAPASAPSDYKRAGMVHSKCFHHCRSYDSRAENP